MSALSEADLRKKAAAAGFSGYALDMIVEIARRESGFNPQAVNDNAGTGDYSIGLTQINLLGNLAPGRMQTLRDWGYTVNSIDDAVRLLKDPDINLRFAHYLSGGGENFQPWTTAAAAEQALGGRGSSSSASTATATSTAASSGLSRADMNSLIDRLRKRVDDLLADPNADPIDITDALNDYYGAVDYVMGLTPDEQRAQQAFDNSIRLGDLGQRAADSAYNRYADKRDAAKAAAETQIQEAGNRNALNADLAKQTFGPVPESRTYFAPMYDDAMKRWSEKFGVGDEPSANPGDYTGGYTQPTFGEGPSGPLPQTATSPAAQKAADTFVPWHERPQTIPDGQPSEGYTGTVPPRVTEPKPVTPSTFVPWDQRGKTARTAAPTSTRNNPWWRTRTGNPVVAYADGTDNAVGGLARVGEKQPETMVTPDGQVQTIGKWGPEVMDVPQGSMVIPQDVPPEEALAYAQITRALQAGGGNERGAQMAAQAQRAADPNVRQRAHESVLRAIAANDATNPPPTPVLMGDWSRYGDPWKNWRGLTGVPASEAEMAAMQQASAGKGA